MPVASQLTCPHLDWIVEWLVQVEEPGAREMQEVFVTSTSPPQRTRPAGVRSAGKREAGLQSRAELFYLQSGHVSGPAVLVRYKPAR